LPQLPAGARNRLQVKLGGAMPWFVPDIEVLVGFGIASFVLAITPGPDMAFFLGRTIGHGRRAGIVCVMGAVTGIAIHTFAVALGLSALLVASVTAFTVIKYCGAVYLLWLAIMAIKNGATFELEPGSADLPLGQAYLQATLINVLNPKVAIFFLTFLPQFVDVHDPAIFAKLMFLGGFFVVVSVPTVLPLVLFADQLALFLRSSKRAMRVFDWSFASVLGAFAIKLIVTRPT
jgi:threonine/homoserine/homoserine lactone efflux protein